MCSELVQLKLNIESSVGESTSFATKYSYQERAARRNPPPEAFVTEAEHGVPLPLVEVGVSRLDVRASEQGFTLLEMLLVIILLAGSGFYLLIKLPVNFEKQRLAFESTQLLEDIRDTRQAALAENNWYAVKFYHQTGDHHYQILKQNKLIKNVYLEDGIEFLGSTEDLNFNALGRSVGTTITLTNSLGERRSVIVGAVGMRIREK